MWACIRGARTSWTARTITATNPVRCRRPRRHLISSGAMKIRVSSPSCRCCPCHARRASAPSTRLSPRGTSVSESQASDLTLTLTQVAVRPVQTWVRTAGAIDAARKVITVHLAGAEADARQGGAARAHVSGGVALVDVPGARRPRHARGPRRARRRRARRAVRRPDTTSYVVEIVTERGDLLSVPNEAIIEEGGTPRRLRAARRRSVRAARTVKTGVQGELYTQITRRA